MRLLLLEDDHDAAEALSVALVHIDPRYEIRHVDRLQDAARIVACERMDVALVDLSLPDAEGAESAVAIKAMNPSLPVVALTGGDFDSLAIDLIRNGVQDFLRKGDTSVRRIHQALQFAMERQRHEEYLRKRASYDALTGVLNQGELLVQLSKAISHARRSGTLGAVMVIDVDDFKSINDRYGHGVGDQVLTKIAAHLSACVRIGDTIGRIGGDEFVVVLEGVETREHAAAAARKMREVTCFDVVADAGTVRVSTSIGVSLFPRQADDPHTVLKLADQAMYAAKRRGKNTFSLYSTRGWRRASAGGG